MRGKYATRRVYRPEADEIRRQEVVAEEPEAAGSLLVWDPRVLNQYEGKWQRVDAQFLSEMRGAHP